ncbi:MAG: hypothetical protein GY720_08740 [bacterium]|nr:hypothetical protein [bacterium]
MATTALPSRHEGHGFDGYYELVLDTQVAMKCILRLERTRAGRNGR